MVSKTLLDDTRLSWAAKGIAAYLVGKPPGWKMRVSDLVKHGIEGKHAVRVAINELRAFGYAQFTQPRENGKVQAGVWEVSDEPEYAPHTKKRKADEPRSNSQEPENRDTENQHHSKNDSNENDCNKIDRAEPAVEKKSHSSIPSEEEVKEYAAELRVPILTAEKFHDHYEAIGWRIGGSRIVDWEAKFRNWVRKDAESKIPAKAAGCNL